MTDTRQQNNRGQPASQLSFSWATFGWRILILYAIYYFLYDFKSGGHKSRPVDSSGNVVLPHRNNMLPNQSLDLWVYLSEDAY
jgi:hypothetical protein